MSDSANRHPSTEPCPPPSEEPLTDHGGHAPEPPAPPQVQRLTDEGRDGLLLRMAPALEYLVQAVGRIEERLGRIEADVSLVAHQDRRIGSEVAQLREELDGLACRRRSNGSSREACPVG